MRRLTVLLLLLALVVGVRQVAALGAIGPSIGVGLAELALALLAALAAGEGAARLGVPRLVAYTAVGLLLGPVAAAALGPEHALLGSGRMPALGVFRATALALIAFAAGFALDLRSLRASWRLAAAVLTAVVLVTGGLVGATAFGLTWVAPGTLGLVPGLETATLLALLLLGTSPVVVAAVLSDAGARGRLASMTLALAATQAVILLVLVHLAAPGQSPLAGTIFAPTEILDTPSAVGSALAGGLGLGVVLLLAGRWLGGRGALPLLVVLAAVAGGLGATPGATGEAPLAIATVAFVLGGVMVRTLGGSGVGQPIAYALEDLTMPAALVLFTLLAASLSLPGLEAWLGAAVLLAARAFGLWLSVRIAARVAGVADTLAPSAWLALTPLDGLTLGLGVVAFGEAHPLVGAIVLAHLLLAPIGLKVALRQAGELRDARGRGDRATTTDPGLPAAPDAEDAPLDEAPDPLEEPRSPRDPDLQRAWRRTLLGVVTLRDDVHRQAVLPRLERLAAATRDAATHARHAIQTASEACGRAEDAVAAVQAITEHRQTLARHVLGDLDRLQAPAGDPEVPGVLDLVAEGVEPIVRAAPAEMDAPETELHLTPGDGDPPLAQVRKLLKGRLRALERFLGRPTRRRLVPMRRIVRRAVGGQLVIEARRLETLVGRAELKALRRLETLLRSADDVLIEASKRLTDGTAPDLVREWMQQRLSDLRESSRDAQQDVLRLAAEPTRRLSEAARAAVDAVAEMADVAGTFELGEPRLSKAAIAPQVRAAIAEAPAERARWAEREAAHLARTSLWFRLVLLRAELREAVLQDALGPAKRMHARIGQLIEAARRHVAEAREAAAADGADADGASTQALLELLRRRVERPLDGVALALRSAGIVDRLLAALETATSHLPTEVDLLAEPGILALARGRATTGTPVAVAVREVARDFFDRRVAVRLAEHTRALETSAEEAAAGVRDVRRLLVAQRGWDEDEGEAETEAQREGRQSNLLETLDAALVRLDQEGVQVADSLAALLGEISLTESLAVHELWRRLQELAETPVLDVALTGLARSLQQARARLAEALRVEWFRTQLRRALSLVRATREAVEARVDPTLGGPARVRQAVDRLRPGGDDIPYVYGKLFSLDPSENDAFIVGRDRELDLARERLEGPHGGALCLVGARGSGRTSLLRLALARSAAGRTVHRLLVDHPFEDADQIVKWVARSVGLATPKPTLDGVAAALRREGAVLVLDDLERVVARSAAGLKALTALTRLIALSETSAMWVATAETRVWGLLRDASAVTDLFDTVIYLGPLSAAAVEEAVTRRHSLSGLSLEFTTRRPLLRAALAPRAGSPRTRYFRRLAELSRGHPRTALQLWVLSLTRLDERRFEVAEPPSPQVLELRSIPTRLSGALDLAFAHGLVDAGHLVRATGWTLVEAQAALQALAGAGLVVTRPRVDGELAWAVPAWSQAAVACHLGDVGLGRRRGGATT